MPTEQPWGQQAIMYDAREDRRMLNRLPIQAGVFAAGDLKVAPGAGLVLAVAAGDAWVTGSHAGVTRQGNYPVRLDASENVTISAAHATLPRIDQVVLRVRDTAPAPGVAGDAENTGKLEVVTGTATSGATLANRTGAAAAPASSIRLADVLVPAAFAGPFVAATHIRDRRPWARGAFARKLRSAGDVSVTSTTFVNLTADIDTKLETSGGPVRMVLMGAMSAAATISGYYRPKMDGAVLDGTGGDQFKQTLTASYQAPISFEWVTVPSAGFHTFQWDVRASSGTLVVQANAATPLVAIVEELLRQDTSNDGA